MTHLRILNLGAGVQSTAVFLMSRDGIIPPIDHAIFADTQEEPKAVYDHLEWMKHLPAPTPAIHIATAGKLGDHLMKGTNSTNKRFATIPAYTATHHAQRNHRHSCNEGMLRRQCTKEYKIEVVERVIRRKLLGLKAHKHIPKGTQINQLFGISLDEKRRADRIVTNWKDRRWASPSFPLIELKWTRTDCLHYLQTRVPHNVTRSACVFCPYKSANEWLQTKANPKEWARATEIDEALRTTGNVINRNLNQALYLHRDCIPLAMVDLEAKAKQEQEKKSRPLFDLMECEGMCGN